MKITIRRTRNPKLVASPGVRISHAQGNTRIGAESASLEARVAALESTVGSHGTLLSGYADFATTFCVSGSPVSKTVLVK